MFPVFDFCIVQKCSVCKAVERFSKLVYGEDSLWRKILFVSKKERKRRSEKIGNLFNLTEYWDSSLTIQ